MDTHASAQLPKTVCVLLCAGLCTVTAHGAPIRSFSNPQSFFSSAQVVSTETFDEFQTDTAIGLGILTLDGISYTSPNPAAIWYVTDTFVTPSPPNSLVIGNLIEPEMLTFAGGGFTDAIGFFLVGIGAFPRPFFRIDVVAADGQTLTEQIVSGPDTPIMFRGFVYENGISSVTITPLNLEGGLSNFTLDNVSRGAISPIPEPSSLTLAAIGIAALTSAQASARLSFRLRLVGAGGRLLDALKLLRRLLVPPIDRQHAAPSLQARRERFIRTRGRGDCRRPNRL